MKINFNLKSTRDSKQLEVSEQLLEKCRVQTQTLAIIANALGIDKPISNFTNKDNEEVYYVSFDNCKEILEEFGNLQVK